MTLRPSISRCRLGWKVFSQEGPRNWKLVLPSYYATLFEDVLQQLLKKNSDGFHDTSRGKHRFAAFPDLDERDVSKIQAFLDFYERTLCLSTNKNIENDFTDELDFCVALDLIRSAPNRKDRTEIGEWEHQAKYSQDADA